MPPTTTINGQRCCTVCRMWKDLEHFSSNIGRNGQRYHRSVCRPCAARKEGSALRRRILYAEQKTPGQRCCGHCRQLKPVDQFAPTAMTCRACARHMHLVRKFKITSEQVEQMLKAQGDLCAICGQREPTDVDHDHRTGQVRGLLCNRCNLGLGAYDDNLDLLRAAAAYLERSRKQ